MLTEKFVEGIFKRVPGIGLPLVLVFKQKADVRRAMSLLQGVERNGVLTIDERDQLVVMVMLQSGDYGHDENRNVHVTLRRTDRPDLFTPIVQHLEGAKLGTEHELSALQSARLKKREEARQKLVSRWITAKVKEAVNDWGLSLSDRLVEEDGFHMLELTLQNGEEMVGTYRLDGWSGNMNRNQERHVLRKSSIENLERFMLRDIENYVEDFTSV